MTRPWRAAFFAALAVISWLALTPQDRLPPIHLWDKLSHALAFATLAALAGSGWPMAKLATIGAPLLAYGLLIEILQLWIPGREFSWLDVLADAVGIGGYIIAAPILARWRRQPLSAPPRIP